MHGSEMVNRRSDVDGFVTQVLILGASRSPFCRPKILVLGGTIEEYVPMFNLKLVRCLNIQIALYLNNEQGA